MVRQARSEATRHKIIDSAVDLINEVGYPAAGLADIIERAELTKGALYYHFDSKEALATTIIEDGGMKMLVAFQEACRAGSPSMENVIHGVFMVSDIINSDGLARAASRLLRTFGGFNTAAKSTYAMFVAEMISSVTTAIAEGDLRPDIDPEIMGRAVVASLLGAEMLSTALSDGDDLNKQITNTWELLLPAIVQADSLNYYLEFLTRQSSHASTARPQSSSQFDERQPARKAL